ncbi:hypothetical protein IMZ11_35205 [Microtetraspora sp. AC03309]|uniref:HEAT repeat domain-containing protein n=1 Tax=Microtetraspora sp. AC03309 TaxID=2779376 RepID=UPI001E395F96|nr:hypothetical protein [Microtetraspora sp. AC03309]MCC5580875.1 hypothetical protein [Microtetraspora sp. AC03309]
MRPIAEIVASVRSRINSLNEAGELRGRGVDPAWPEAWAASIPPLLESLDDADVHVRRMTTWALGAARPQAETVVDRLRARWPAEPDLTVRLGLVLAAGKLSPYGATWLQGLREHREPQVQLAATMALGRLAEDIDLVCGAVREGDLAAWRHNPWYGGTPESLVWGIDHELGGHCRARIRFATRMPAHRDPQVRIGGVKAAGVVLSTWLSALPELLPPLVEHLDDPDATVRAFALHLLVASGEAGPHLDRLAAMLADETRLSRRGEARIADIALWGLAWAGDRRARPGLLDQLSTGGVRFPRSANLFGTSPYMTALPGLHELLGRLEGWADVLVPAVRDLLRRADNVELRRVLAQTLEAWGASAAPAVPELRSLLDGDARLWAAAALGAIGPDAESALPALRRPPRTATGHLSGVERVTTAWALWRVTGDAEPALAMIGAALEQGRSNKALRLLADFGPLAARHEEPLRRSLTDIGDWERVEAAHALWRVTGDPTDAVPVLLQTIQALPEGKVTPVMAAAIGYLGEIGAPAAGAAPLLEAALAGDLRLNYFGGWRAFAEDGERRRHLRRALDRIQDATAR